MTDASPILERLIHFTVADPVRIPEIKKLCGKHSFLILRGGELPGSAGMIQRLRLLAEADFAFGTLYDSPAAETADELVLLLAAAFLAG